MDKLLHWTPRTLSLFFVAFLSLFALDVFETSQGWEVVPALFMHLVPSLILLAITFAAWKYDLIGAAVYIGFALWYVWTVGFNRPLSWYLAIAAPAALIGILYIAKWLRAKQVSN